MLSYPVRKNSEHFKSLLFKKSLPWVVIFIGLLIWELVVILFKIPEFVLPSPIKIFQALWEFRAVIFENALHTLITTLIGFAIAIIIGLIGGVFLGSSVLIYEAFYPALIAFNSVPKVALIPILVIWFGIGTIPAIITAFLLSFFPIVVNVSTGIAGVEPELRDVLRSLGATRLQMIYKVGIPRSMPYFFASLKVSMTVAFVGSIVSETVASNNGVGYLILVASSRFQVSLAFACLFVTGILGILMYAVCTFIEKRTTGWSMRGVQGVSFSN
jgi:NitT/TauT family transport system permease protein